MCNGILNLLETGYLRLGKAAVKRITVIKFQVKMEVAMLQGSSNQSNSGYSKVNNTEFGDEIWPRKVRCSSA